MFFKILTSILVIVLLVISIIILININKRCPEKYSSLFPQPDRRVLKGSIDCAYSLNGSNTAYCNNWLDSYRTGKLCETDSFGKVCCENALKCCNQLATCGGGNDCRDQKYRPTKNNKLRYDEDIYIDQ